MRKDVLEKRMKRLMDKKQKLTERCKASQDVNEVRDLTDQLDDLNAEISETQDELDAIKAEEERSAQPVQVETRNADIAKASVASFKAPEQRSEDKYASMEYRKAFMAYAQRGVAIPAEFRASDGIGPNNTTDLGAIIPTTIINEFIQKVRKVYGNLYAKVRKLNIKGGVKFPIADLSAKFKWITESTVSPRQDAGEINQFVEFSYNLGEIRVSQTLLSSIVALDLFESEVVRVMMEAYVQAMDYGIIHGTGNGQMLGILNDPRVAATQQVITMTAADLNDWTKWRKKLFAALPLGRRDGEFIFPISTVESYLLTMADANNNPIFREATDLSVNDGDVPQPSARFFGREVSLVEPDIIQDFDTASSGDVIGVFWQPKDYAINTNLAFGMKRYFDEEKNEWVNKALTIVDGKILDPYGVWLIKKA